jgi:hypothetical protein
MEAAAQPKARKVVGKTIAEVRALDTSVSGYTLVFTDGTSVTIQTDIPVFLVDDEKHWD